jgi:hypothetical protein
MIRKPIPQRHQEQLDAVRKYGESIGPGKSLTIAHLQGKRLQSKQRIQSFCWLCCGMMADGDPASACNDTTCPLFPVFYDTYVARKKEPAETPLYEPISKMEGAE